jgi:hypothetical protein
MEKRYHLSKKTHGGYCILDPEGKICTKLFYYKYKGHQIIMSLYVSGRLNAFDGASLVAELIECPLPNLSKYLNLRLIERAEEERAFVQELLDSLETYIVDLPWYEEEREVPFFQYHEQLGYGNFYFISTIEEDDDEEDPSPELISDDLYSKAEALDWLQRYMKTIQMDDPVIDYIKLKKSVTDIPDKIFVPQDREYLEARN